MVAEEAKVEQAKVAVAVQRKAARANLVHKQGLERSAAAARAEVATLVVRSRAARGAGGPRPARGRQVQLRALKKQEDRIRALIIERARKQRAGSRVTPAASERGGSRHADNSPRCITNSGSPKPTPTSVLSARRCMADGIRSTAE